MVLTVSQLNKVNSATSLSVITRLNPYTKRLNVWV